MNSSKKWIWLYKYSNDWANFFGGILVLCIGLIIFFSITLWNDLLHYKIQLFLLSIIICGMFSYFFMMHFAYKIPEIERISKEWLFEENHKDKVYLINIDRIETLKAAGVPSDILNCLNKLLNNPQNTEKQLKMTLSPESEENWYKDLRDILGDARVEEFENLIFKYTQKKM